MLNVATTPKIYLFCFRKFENTNYISSAIIFKCIQDEIMHASHIRLIDMHSSVIRDSPKNNVQCKIRNKITFSYCIHLEIIFCGLGPQLQHTPRSTNPVCKIALTMPGTQVHTNLPTSIRPAPQSYQAFTCLCSTQAGDCRHPRVITRSVLLPGELVSNPFSKAPALCSWICQFTCLSICTKRVSLAFLLSRPFVGCG